MFSQVDTLVDTKKAEPSLNPAWGYHICAKRLFLKTKAYIGFRIIIMPRSRFVQ
jgi:hypothetical protein